MYSISGNDSYIYPNACTHPHSHAYTHTHIHIYVCGPAGLATLKISDRTKQSVCG